MSETGNNGLCECGCGTATEAAKLTGKPKRFINGHQCRKSLVEYVEQDEGYETPCWIWQRSIQSAGYGNLLVEGHHVLAHRYYWEKTNGPIPLGLSLDHLCRNPACVNPEHLEPVTQAENVRRGANTKLTLAQVAEIRSCGGSGAEVAARFGVSKSTVLHIRQGRIWRDAA